MTVGPFQYGKPAAAPSAGPATRVLISSPKDQATAWALEELDPVSFDVHRVESGPTFVRAAVEFCPHVVVLDRVHQRVEEAQMEFAVVKNLRPEARVIIISERSSAEDAPIVEQGVFYYLTNLDHQELVRVVKAAVHGLHGNQREEPQ